MQKIFKPVCIIKKVVLWEQFPLHCDHTGDMNVKLRWMRAHWEQDNQADEANVEQTSIWESIYEDVWQKFPLHPQRVYVCVL